MLATLMLYNIANKWMLLEPLTEKGCGRGSYTRSAFVKSFVDLSQTIFRFLKEASTYPCIISVDKGEPSGTLQIVNMDELAFVPV